MVNVRAGGTISVLEPELWYEYDYGVVGRKLEFVRNPCSHQLWDWHYRPWEPVSTGIEIQPVSLCTSCEMIYTDRPVCRHCTYEEDLGTQQSMSVFTERLIEERRHHLEVIKRL